MSRFGLRSHTDTTTTYEEYDDDDEDQNKNAPLGKTSENNSNKSTTTTTSAKTKRSTHNKQKQKKNKKKSLTTLNGHDANDVVAPTTIPANNNKNNNTISLICSFPLTRLSGILEKLQLTKNAKKQAKYLMQQQKHDAAELKTKNALFDSLKLTTFNVQETKTLKSVNFNNIVVNDDNGNGNNDDDDDEDDDNDEGSTAAGVKLLCLYCDKKFLTEKLQVKHVDKFHIQQRDRRLSARNNLQQQQQQLKLDQKDKLTTTTTTTTTTSTTKLNEQYSNKNASSSSSSTKTSITTTTTQQQQQELMQQQIIQSNNFPGCTYCKKYKNNNSNINKHVATSNEYNLNSLFLHLIECHSDKYFGCKTCIMRFATKPKLLKHMKNVHNTKYPTTTSSSSLTTTTLSSSSTSSSMLPYQKKVEEKPLNHIEIDNDYESATSTKNSQQQHQSLNKSTSTYKSTQRVLRQTRKSQQQQQEATKDSSSSPETINTTITTTSNMVPNDEPRLSRLGLAQNRFNSKNNNNTKRKGLRLRRDLVEAVEPPMPSHYQLSNSKLRSSRISTTPITLASHSQSAAVVSCTTPTSGGRGNNHSQNLDDETTNQTLFRMPIRHDLMSSSSSSYSSTTTITTTTTTTNCSTSFIIDDNFYKEVVNNVRSNLLYYLDGKIKEQLHQFTNNASLALHDNDNDDDNNVIKHVSAIRSTLVRSPLLLSHRIVGRGRGNLGSDEDDDDELLENGELHAATSLTAITAFPTLLTAEQYGGENYGKLRRRRAHTKHSWKWKWDSVKKYKLISEGGKMVKKMKPLLGLRDLSKLDMWTQLTMRQKHEKQQQLQQLASTSNHLLSTTTTTMPATTSTTVGDYIGNHVKRAEKLRLNEELNAILDKRLLPQIILEQNEQAVIKVEPFSTDDEQQQQLQSTAHNHTMAVATLDKNFNGNDQNDYEHFLQLLQLNKRTTAMKNMSMSINSPRLVLSGEWARPRCYMCMCCGAKFDKLKSLEEHKMFRHAHIYCTHYEVVGRELLANNLLRHLFLPRRALSRYNANYCNVFVDNSSNENSSSEALLQGGLGGNRLEWTAQHKRRSSSSMTTTATTSTTINLRTPPTVEDESSDSIQSINRYAVTTPTTAASTTSTITPPTTSSSMVITTLQQQQQLSPTYSLQSCSSFRHNMALSLSPISTPTLRTPSKIYQQQSHDLGHVKEMLRNCSKCQRKCNGSMDLYRHMLDCSGDYIWSMVKKRKYRYYCGTKKRRVRYGAELRKTPKQQQQPKTPENLNEERSTSSCSKSHQLKNSPTPRTRPSDAESIKKMLANLPAKRVCKQIFPMGKNNRKNKNNNKNHNSILNKKNKQQQQQRSNLYKTNVLRQTRARQQMAQAAKILSKTKNKKQHKQQQQQMKSVCKTVAKVAGVNDERNLRKTKNATSVTTTTTTSNSKKSDNEEKLSANKQTLSKKNKQNTKNEQQSTSIEKPAAVEVMTSPTTNTITMPTTTSPLSLKPTTTAMTKNDEFDGRLLPEYGNSNASSTSTCTTNTLNSSLSATIMAMTATTTTSSTTPMTTRKRSKRISDCIAMLTGKLEEKLKTDLTPITPTTKINTRSATNNNNNNNNNQMEIITKALPEIAATRTTPTTSTLASPKTPKRKAQSRRIIKAPSIENLVTHVDLTMSPTQPLLQQPKMPITRTTTTNTVGDFILPVTAPTTPKSTSATASNLQSITATTATTTSMTTLMTTTTKTTNQKSIPIPSTAATPSSLALSPTATPKSATTPLLQAVKVNLATNFQQLPVPISMQNFALMGVTAQLPHSPLNKNNIPAKTMTVAATTTPLISVASNNKAKTTPIPMPMVKISPTNYSTPSMTATSMPLALAPLPLHMPLAMPLMPTYNVASEMEQPLNLSSSSAINGPGDQSMTDATNDRRNVILGMPPYHVDSFNMFQSVETGPLDLSTKCHTKTTSSAAKEVDNNNSAAMMPLALTVSSNSTPISQYLTTTSTNTDMIMYNKQQQYYSNLDLLKIPQIRNSTYSSTATTSNSTSGAPIITTTTTTPQNNLSIINMSKNNNNYQDVGNNNTTNVALQVLQGSAITTTKATMVVAPIIKKRGGYRQHNLYDISALSSTLTTSTITSTTTSTAPNLNASVMSSIYTNMNNNTMTTTPNKIIQKKEYASRYKAPPAPLTMNEEVINHIDDAINSVINAVKASFSPERVDNNCAGQIFMEDACKSVQLPIPPEITFTTTTTIPAPSTNADVITTNILSIIATTTSGFPLSTNTVANVNITATTPATTAQPLATILPVKRRGRSKAIDHQAVPLEHFVQPLTSDATSILPNTFVTEFQRALPQTVTPIATTDTITTIAQVTSMSKTAEQLKTQYQVPLCATTNTTTTTPTVSIKPRSKVARSMVCLIEDISEPVPTPKILTNLIQENQDQRKKDEKMNQIPDVDLTKDEMQSAAIAPVPTTTSTISTTTTTASELSRNVEEDQSKQQVTTTTAAATTIENTITTNTTVSNNNNGENVQTNGKKFRRRRKNELAAIVADQLLESFKLDKARRDNLKKLENLAYEKSDDLFMTGMLLMSSTKRSATLNSAKQKQQQEKEQQQQQNNNLDDDLNNDDMENYNNNKRTGLRARTTRQSINNNNNNNSNNKNDDKIPATTTSKNPKDGRRRPYRRRGKTLDNENISKLKSSLESFSIGIERQLTEFEAKKERLNEANASKATTNANNNSGIKTKPCSVILRPSILAASIEPPPVVISAPLTAENVAKVSLSLAADNGKSSAFSCRDPRLNKNIHKELGDSVEKTGVGHESKNDNVDSCEEEDNYLTEIAKNVNEKIMENEDFMFANDDGLLGLDDTQSSHYYSRPPTSMSVRSAPNFDDRSNYGSMCGDDDDDEITNTEVMDMDLDDDMSVYTSYSQDVGRGGRRRRRRRRSILLTRRPKKRISRDPDATEKFECTLCKKIFFSATSLSKHNMTLAHVSKVSEQEYLLSRAAMIEQGGLVAMANELPMSFPKATNNRRAKTPTPNASRGRAKTPTPISNPRGRAKTPTPTSNTVQRGRAKTPTPAAPRGRPKTPTPNAPKERAKTPSPIRTISLSKRRAKTPTPTVSTRGRGKTPTPTQKAHTLEDQFYAMPNTTTTSIIPDHVKDVKEKLAMQTATTTGSPAFGTSSHLTLNPDERLFFECCTILKGTETVRPSNNTPPSKMDEVQFGLQNKDKEATVADNSVNQSKSQSSTKKHQNKTTATFRDPPSYNKTETDRMSPNYPGISQLSAVTNTSTFRMKTKAAMKGYENVDMSLPPDLMDMNKQSHHNHHHNQHHQNTCKLTELADIALGSEKPHALTSRQDPANIKRGNTSVGDFLPKPRTESSTSSKTIMHSSILNAVIEERSKLPEVQKIVIPERPFKNIGLEEKEPITFQKPRTTSLCLLKSGSPLVSAAISVLPDENSITSASFSDRDDFDFNSITCDDDEDNGANNKTPGVDITEQESSNRGGVKTPTNSDEQAMIGIPPPGLSESSSNHKINNNDQNSDSDASRATAKTFENKSLIMGRIFKNNTTKVPAPSVVIKATPVKIKNPLPKADLNQLFDELRGDCNKNKINEHPPITTTTTTQAGTNNEVNLQANVEPLAVMPPENAVDKIQRNALVKKVSIEDKKTLPKKKVTINLPTTTTSTATSPINVGSFVKTKKKVGRKPKANKKASATTTEAAVAEKDIEITAPIIEKFPKNQKPKKKKQHATAKLEAELGMSPKAIREQINDVGQRKSTRRCAANSAKKFVETWSSDEYEEFLSTKDVIALIEEKEKQELEKKKRKSCNFIASTTKVAGEEVPTQKGFEDKDNNFTPNVETCKETYAFVTPQPTLVNPTRGKQKTKDNKKTGNKKKDKRKDQEAKNQIVSVTTNARENEQGDEEEDSLVNKMPSKNNNNNNNNNNSNVQSLWNYTKELSGNSSNNRKRKHKHGNHGEMDLSTASSGIVAAESYIMPMGYNDMIGSATRPCMLVTDQPQQHQLQQPPPQSVGLQLMHSMSTPFVAAATTTQKTTTTTLYEQQQQQQQKRHHHHHHHKTTSHHHHHHHHHKKHHKERKNLKRKIVLDSTDAMPIIQPCSRPMNTTTSATSTMSGVESVRKRGRKRKSETKSKHSRRKREKHYYWSSSSSTSSSSPSSSSSLSSTASSRSSSESDAEDSDNDDEFSNVVANTNEHVIQPAKLSYQPQLQYGTTTTLTSTTSASYGANNGLSGNREGGEHMQKHGWIVGDSHKKLVTMLAIAKGSHKNSNGNGNSSSSKKVTKKKNSKKRGRQD